MFTAPIMTDVPNWTMPKDPGFCHLVVFIELDLLRNNPEGIRESGASLVYLVDYFYREIDIHAKTLKSEKAW